MDAQIAQVCFLAKQKADEIFKQPDNSHLSHSEIYNSLKIMIMPMEILISSLKSLPCAQIKTVYWQLALAVHPDKNWYVSSKLAFLKLNEAYTECMSS